MKVNLQFQLTLLGSCNARAPFYMFYARHINTSIRTHPADKITSQHDSGKPLHNTTDELCESLQESFIELPERFYHISVSLREEIRKALKDIQIT